MCRRDVEPMPIIVNMNTLRIALAQINTTVGDLNGNRDWILAFCDRARQAGADIVAVPEMAVTGYPPEDLVQETFYYRQYRGA